MVAGWGAYLVPFWAHRHDGPAAELRSIQGFSTAMRTLSRRKTGYVDGRYVLMPGARPTAALPQAVHVSGAGVRRPADHTLVRRRQALLSLLVVSAVSMPLAIFVGGLTSWLTAVSLLSTAGYAVVLRRATVRANERRRRARQFTHRRHLEAERAEYLVRTEAAADAAAHPVRQAPPVRYVAPEPEFVDSGWRRVVGE